jgi:hypothetical protein
MREWQLSWKPKPGSSKEPSFVWRHHGEITLSLRLRGNLYSNSTAFEIARDIDHPSAIPALSPFGREKAADAFREGESHYLDVYWFGTTPEDLASFCHDARIDPPQGYVAAWKFVNKNTPQNEK